MQSMTEKLVSVLTIRPYEPSDYDAVWHLHIYALQKAGAYVGDGPWDDDMRNIEGVYMNDRSIFLVGLCETQLVAMGAFRQVTRLFPSKILPNYPPEGLRDRAQITRMRVHPDFQGRGFGHQILRALEIQATEFGYKTLHLETSVLQIAAQTLYRKNGFQETERLVVRGLDSILFEKAIG
ncbi:MAG: GNAT family N-acetyltransferase [Cyanobacteria bacterium CRU_2_1]|nr:GNAT family N-acetyltransferase [Cyanobacteria bacterium RU_5_0]NJR61413.1 GNAT family N-acetyltransferase [Cyanobacteria bacterium CRU_2_1]